MSDWSTLQQRARGRWQAPLLVASLALLGLAAWRLRPDARALPLDRAVAYLETLEESGLHRRVTQLASVLLEKHRDRGSELGPLYHLLGQAEGRSANETGDASLATWSRVRTHFDQAVELGVTLSGADLELLGRAAESEDRPAKAVEHYEAALASGVEDPSNLRRHVLLLRRDRLGVTGDMLLAELKRYLAELPDHRLEDRLWAVEQQVEMLDELGRLEEAAGLLVSEQSRFVDSDFASRFAVLEALLLYKSAHFDEAELLLRTLRNGMDRFSEAYAMSGWLLGHVVLSDGGPQRPQEALSFFEDVIHRHPGSLYAAASRLGAAQASAMLERHDDALSLYEAALEDTAALRKRRLIDADAVRASLSVTAEAQRQAGHFAAALGYAELAARLTDPTDEPARLAVLEPLGHLQILRAEELEGTSAESREAADLPRPTKHPESRRHFDRAAVTYGEIAKLSTFQEDRAAQASWLSAELLARAGRYQDAAERFAAFARERPTNALVARALLRVGQLRLWAGRPDQAIAAFQECYNRFPRSLDGARALVPLAQAYLATGPGNEELAEQTLRVVLEDSEVFTPQASAFAEALFMLGDVLNRREDNERAVAYLTEAIERYPDDPRVWRARYLLADSYRRSAAGLMTEADQATVESERNRLREESARRYEHARRLYRELIQEYDVRPSTALSALEAMYLRHAYLYEADCSFATQDYRSALKLYEDAAGLYSGGVAALAAYVQIINCHVFLGQRGEAKAALARAMVLTETMPDTAFEAGFTPETRADWKGYFEWLGTSGLF